MFLSLEIKTTDSKPASRYLITLRSIYRQTIHVVLVEIKSRAVVSLESVLLHFFLKNRYLFFGKKVAYNLSHNNRNSSLTGKQFQIYERF